MLGTLNTPVLSLTPDSLASLGELDGDSLSELWGVFTKCKDSLQNGRRLENLSWRLWFDSGRREAQSEQVQRVERCNPTRRGVANVPPSPATTIASVDTDGWSDPEWTEAETSDSEADDTPARPGRPRRDSSSETTATINTIPDSSRRGTSHADNFSTTPLDVPASGSKARSTSAGASQATRPSLAATAARVSSSREWRTSTTISGGSIQRIVAGFNSLPPIVAPKARSIANVPINSTPLSVDNGTTSRHSSAPEPLEVGILAENALALHPTSSPPASSAFATLSPRRKVDAPTQTTPSSSHRPSPAVALRSPPTSVRPVMGAAIPPTPSPQQSTSGSTGSRGMVRSSSGQSNSSRTSSRMTKIPPPPMSTASTSSAAAPALPRHLSTSSSAGRRGSSSRPSAAPTPAPTPAPSLVVANHLTRTPSALSYNSSSPQNPLPSTSIAKSSVKGFDTRVEDARPRTGSIAPPPTPAAPAKAALASSPPKSAMKASATSSSAAATETATATAPTTPAVAVATSTRLKPTATTKKQMFFISSPASDSEDDAGSSRSRRYSSGAERYASHSRGTPRSMGAAAATAMNGHKGKGREVVHAAAADDNDEEWDDEDDEDLSDDDNDSSSGWGSEYSTESDEASRRERDERSAKALFQKRPSVVLNGDAPLKPRPPGLLSQLFHPDLLLGDGDRAHSSIDVARTRSNLSMTAAPASKMMTSKSHGMLSAQRSKSFLKGAPEGVELESSSDEGSDSEVEVAQDMQPGDSQNQIAVALARHAQRQRQLEAEGPIAPPQTPRTTRRAMLATELSESLRRNLLWERQTRNRVMGATARAPAMPPATTTATATAPPPAATAATAAPSSKANSADGVINLGLRAPNPSPASRDTSPADNGHASQTAEQPVQHSAHPTTSTMVRRHTTGTGLYLAAQQDKLDRAREVPRTGRQRRCSGGLDGDDTSTSVSSDEEEGDDYGDSIWGQRVW